MSWGDDKNGKGDVFSPVSWDAASKADSNWAFAPTSSSESSFFSASVWDSPSTQTNYFSPVELTPVYGSVENNRSSSFSGNPGDSWAFKSAENNSSPFTASDKPSFGFGDSFGFKSDQDLSYLESQQSKVFDVFSNTASELESYHATRSMKESRAANSWFCSSGSSESSSWAFSKEEPAQTNSIFSPTPAAEASSWAFSREEPSTTSSVFSPSPSTEQNNWAFARAEQPSSNFFSNSNESSALSSWAFSAVDHLTGEGVSKIVNPFSTKKE